MSMFHDASFTLIGNLTRDAEKRQVGEREIISLRVARNRRFQKNGQWTKEVDYWNVDYWKEMINDVFDRLKVGSVVYVKGDPQQVTFNTMGGTPKTEPIIRAICLIPLSDPQAQASATKPRQNKQKDNVGQPGPAVMVSYANEPMIEDDMVIE